MTLAARDEAFNMLIIVVIKRAQKKEEKSEQDETRCVGEKQSS